MWLMATAVWIVAIMLEYAHLSNRSSRKPEWIKGKRDREKRNKTLFKKISKNLKDASFQIEQALRKPGKIDELDLDQVLHNISKHQGLRKLSRLQRK